jgi:outer membrane lipoprotein carrier protein
MSQRVKALTLKVASNGTIEQMQIEEMDGSVTAFSFSGIEENIRVKNEDFVFHAPAGVAIVNGLPPI